jgi:hypothetical protein
MSEEQEVTTNDGTWSGLKKTIIGVATTAVMGLGTWGVTKMTGGGDEATPAPQAAPVININNTQQQQQSAGKTVIINQPAPAQKDVKKAENSEKPAPRKKEGDEFKEKPAQW